MHHDRSPQIGHVSRKLRATLDALLDAARYAVDTESTVWDFAISIVRLRELGATDTDLRWLVRKGYVEHGREVTVEGDNGRAFRSTGDLTFSRRTCFVLTQAGVEAAESQCLPSPDGPLPTLSDHSQASEEPPEQWPVPQWDPELRKLHLDGQLVKRFKWPALNQEAVLCAFQEEGWPTRIDDPLPPQPEQDSKRRLADTIKCLNRKQTNELIHFCGDGTGEGVIWERSNGHRRNGRSHNTNGSNGDQGEA